MTCVTAGPAEVKEDGLLHISRVLHQVHQHGLGDKAVAALKTLDNVCSAARNPDDFVIDPLSAEARGNKIKVRNPDMLQVFASREEVQIYRFAVEERLSASAANRLLQIVTKVRY